MRSYRGDSSTKNLSSWRLRLSTTPLLHEIVFEIVEFGKPLSNIFNYRLQDHGVADLPDKDLVTFKPKLTRETDCLATTVLEQFGCLGHARYIP